MKLTLGPFFSTTPALSYDEVGFQPIGHSIEFTLEGDFHSLPIFERVWPDSERLRLGLQDIFILFERHIWPFDFDCYEHHIVSTRAGLFVELGAFLHGFFTELRPASHISDVLSDFLALVPDLKSYPHTHPVCIAITPLLAEKGYRLASVHQFSTRMYAEFFRVFPVNGGREFSVLAAKATFSPKQRRLGEGKWKPIDRAGVLAGLFWNDFKRTFKGTPCDALLGVAQREAILQTFEWGKTTLESAGSLVEQRKEFVKLCPPSMSNAQIAEELIRKQLYSRNTSIHQIAKTVGSWRETLT